MGITVSHHEEEQYDDCTHCYQFNVNCKKHEDELKSPPGNQYNGRTDGKKKSIEEQAPTGHGSSDMPLLSSLS